MTDDQFTIDRTTEREIMVKHRTSQHVYLFWISGDGSELLNRYTIMPNLSSNIDESLLASPARFAAAAYLQEIRGGITPRHELDKP
jgi:hypothetical protein